MENRGWRMGYGECNNAHSMAYIIWRINNGKLVWSVENEMENGSVRIMCRIWSMETKV